MWSSCASPPRLCQQRRSSFAAFIATPAVSGTVTACQGRDRGRPSRRHASRPASSASFYARPPGNPNHGITHLELAQCRKQLAFGQGMNFSCSVAADLDEGRPR